MVEEELDSAQDSQGYRLIKKPNTTSKVWMHFGLNCDEDGTPIPTEIDKPVCRHCHKAVLAKRSNTSNLFSHIKDNHPEIYAELTAQRSSNQPTIGEVVERRKKYDAGSRRAKELDHAIAYFLAKDMQPFYTVEKQGFQKMVSVFDPKYILPSRNYFSEKEIPRMYSEVRDNIVNPAVTKASFYAATTDLWTSCARHPFMSFTIHFTDDKWELKTFCLDTVPILQDHTGHNLAEAIQDVMANWELDPTNLVCVTTDNGSNFLSAFNILNWMRISCFGHNLDLCVNKAIQIDRIQRALGRCHSLVSVFNRSWKKNRDLREKQVHLGIDQHKLISDVVTRWGSTYQMIERILEQQKAISAVLAEDRKNWHHMPTDQEFSVLETVAAVLKPLSIFTDALSGEKHLTISAVRPLLKHIVDEVLAVSPEDNPLSKEMKEIISDKIQTYYIKEEVSDLLDKCTYLDPRFKARYLSNTERVHDQIVREAEVVSSSIVLTDGHNSNNESQAATAAPQPPPPKKTKGLGAILKRIIPQHNDEFRRTPQQLIEKEMSRYEDLADLEPDKDPLKWWCIEAKHFPMLARLASKYLCACATSVASERVFSKAGYIANHFRARLSPDNVNRLVFLSKNL